MIITETIKGIKDILDIYSNENQKKRVINITKEMITRELTYNLSVLCEVQGLMKRKKDRLAAADRYKIIQHLEDKSFEVLTSLGIPLSDIVNGEASHDQTKNSRVRSIITKEQLVEKSFNRIRIQRILARESILKRSDSINYTIDLIRAALRNMQHH
jgi:hypothetical protein